jgi:hypothetical protein
MSNKNLFKEAIADAKAVREAALANAKAALEEALTPRLQSMLSAKLNEMDGDDDLPPPPPEEHSIFEEEEDPLEEDFDLSEILAELDEEDSLEKALENASSTVNQGPTPDDSRSVFQSSGKSGWCFIGQDESVRTCAQIGVNDMCMSGDIFPSQEICMNPSLRP